MMLEIKTDKFSFTKELPAAANALTPRQFKNLCHHKTTSHFKVTLFRKTLKSMGVPRRVLRLLSTADCMDMMEEWKIHDNEVAISSWLAKPCFLWKGPRNALSGITAFQYGFADVHMRKYFEAQSNGESGDKALNALFGALFRLRGLPWTPFLADFYRGLAVLVPRRTKVACAFNFLGAAKWAEITFPRTHSNKKSSGPNYSWPGVFVDLAGVKFGTTRNVGKSPISDVFIHCEQAAHLAD